MRTEEEKASSEYDGIYFLPGEDEDELVLSYFDFNKEMADGIPIENTNFGYMYHIAFFRRDDEGNPIFDDHYEAILGDPETYIKGLTGAGLYGCVLKKTEKSGKWWEEYLKRALSYVTLKKLKTYAESIANT
jgi:hypothetical protein